MRLTSTVDVSAIRVAVARVNPVVRFVAFERGRHGGNFGFSSCACAFVLHIAAGGEHQRRENEDDHDDHQHFDDGDSSLFCGGRRAACILR